MQNVALKAGARHGRLTVLYPARHRDRDGNIFVVCQCKCGTLVTITRPSRVMSCGCYRREQFRKCVNDGLNQGESQGQSILTAEDVKEIKLRRSQGRLQREIADEFGVARTTVSAVLNGYNWKHLTN